MELFKQLEYSCRLCKLLVGQDMLPADQATVVNNKISFSNNGTVKTVASNGATAAQGLILQELMELILLVLMVLHHHFQ